MNLIDKLVLIWNALKWPRRILYIAVALIIAFNIYGILHPKTVIKTEIKEVETIKYKTITKTREIKVIRKEEIKGLNIPQVVEDVLAIGQIPPSEGKTDIYCCLDDLGQGKILSQTHPRPLIGFISGLSVGIDYSAIRSKELGEFRASGEAEVGWVGGLHGYVRAEIDNEGIYRGVVGLRWRFK